MKIVLSRKGFDSTSGGCPSPIFPDGAMLSLPIPDAGSPVKYRDLRWNGHDVGELVERLTSRKVRRSHGAHLDPDLQRAMVSREPDWIPAFGQWGAALGHLRKQQVGPGDLFLFWGLFREVDAELRWRGPPLHVIWGWMRVGAVVSVDASVRREPKRWRWAARHPHLAFAPDATNTLFVADGPSGAGVFSHFLEARRLTAPGAAKPTLWSLPQWFAPAGRSPLTYHADPKRWTASGGRMLLQTVARGQEFVLDAAEYPDAAGWAQDLAAGAQVQVRADISRAR